MKESKEEWIWGRKEGRGIGKSRRKENCGLDVIYDR